MLGWWPCERDNRCRCAQRGRCPSARRPRSSRTTRAAWCSSGGWQAGAGRAVTWCPAGWRRSGWWPRAPLPGPRWRQGSGWTSTACGGGRGRGRQAGPQHWERASAGPSKLTTDLVGQIRALRRGGASLRAIASEVGVSDRLGARRPGRRPCHRRHCWPGGRGQPEGQSTGATGPPRAPREGARTGKCGDAGRGAPGHLRRCELALARGVARPAGAGADGPARRGGESARAAQGGFLLPALAAFGLGLLVAAGRAARRGGEPRRPRGYRPPPRPRPWPRGEDAPAGAWKPWPGCAAPTSCW